MIVSEKHYERHILRRSRNNVPRVLRE